MVYLLFFLIPIVLLLAWVSWSTGSGVGVETWVMTSMWRHRLPGWTRNGGRRNGVPDSNTRRGRQRLWQRSIQVRMMANYRLRSHNPER